MKQGHTFRSPKHIRWLSHCVSCGHIPLSNAISQVVTQAGCNYESDPRYRAWVQSGRKVVPS
jgi:DNA-binding sugar fermentation-stimulating protein